ncbi:Delta(1)-pyrroline-2-carboxylate reductase [Bacillus rhizoplanae]|uniref:Delta(1)-pyrroline-2-carboxylate reductase n=1 Tax=Bacillus rhizoplanae TaxID=2880966 RepID=A0ABM8Y8I2_9BACI|nr:Delta(1)-pyrroline-2-carboxylate reductase [Bacillus rhizoplanae]
MLGVHISSVGSFRLVMQELPSHVISLANKVVVESKEAALEETGDLQIPIQEGLFKESDIHAELGQIISGERTGRESNQEVTVFKSVGLAVVDIVVAKYFYEKAVENGVGTRVEL